VLPAAGEGVGVTDESSVDDAPPAPPKRNVWRIPLIVIVIAFAAFWVWALFFASKEAVNKIDDREWAERAESICAAAELQRLELTNNEEFDPDDPALLIAHADLIDQATDIIEQMLDAVVARPPADDKGAAIVPLWEADYRTFIQNRRDYTANLRAGNADPFHEAAVDGIPISDKLEHFSGDNEMPSCAPPHEQGM
jgi:hypothetical protein